MKKIIISILFAFLLSLFSIPSGNNSDESITFSSFVGSAAAHITCPVVGINSGDCHESIIQIIDGSMVIGCRWTGYQTDHCSAYIGLIGSILEIL